MRQAVREQWELRTVAMTIMDGQATRAWSVNQGLIFFDGRFYLPTASALLPDLLPVLHRGGSANMELLALGGTQTSDVGIAQWDAHGCYSAR
jgi:hypothetical protein